MPAAARKGDLGSGHDSHPPSPAIEGSPDVLINGLAALRRGDNLEPHGCRPTPRTVAEGSASVFVNGMPAARHDDAIDCGGRVETSSEDVFIDDGG